MGARRVLWVYREAVSFFGMSCDHRSLVSLLARNSLT
jgi:hypothetical protein